MELAPREPSLSPPRTFRPSACFLHLDCRDVLSLIMIFSVSSPGGFVQQDVHWRALQADKHGYVQIRSRLDLVSCLLIILPQASRFR